MNKIISDLEVKLSYDILNAMNGCITKHPNQPRHIIVSGEFRPILINGKFAVMPDMQNPKNQYVVFNPVTNKRQVSLIEDFMIEDCEASKIILTLDNEMWNARLVDEDDNDIDSVECYSSETSARVALFLTTYDIEFDDVEFGKLYEKRRRP